MWEISAIQINDQARLIGLQDFTGFSLFQENLIQDLYCNGHGANIDRIASDLWNEFNVEEKIFWQEFPRNCPKCQEHFFLVRLSEIFPNRETILVLGKIE